MSSDVDLHVLYKIANAPINPFPFPHIYVRDVFPPDYYRALREHLPPQQALRTLTSLGRVSDYPDSRLVLPLTSDEIGALPEPCRGFWRHMASWMLGPTFGQVIAQKFLECLVERFGDVRNRRFYDEALIASDTATFALGPHTGTPLKVASLRFYLPADESLAPLGTSIYVPRKPWFVSAGAEPYHLFEDFRRVATMPYLPNTLFAFPKTPNSFHGVEPISDPGVRRDLLLYDIKVTDPPELARQAPAAQPAATAPVKFSF